MQPSAEMEQEAFIKNGYQPFFLFFSVRSIVGEKSNNSGCQYLLYARHVCLRLQFSLQALGFLRTRPFFFGHQIYFVFSIRLKFR